MNKKLLGDYVTVEREIKVLEERKQAIRAAILADFKANQIEKVESDFGNFTVAHKRSWVYSPKITTMAEKLKIAKIKEEEKGIAKPIESEYLIFKPKLNE